MKTKWRYAFTFIWAIAALSSTAYAQNSGGKTHIQLPTSCQKNGGGYSATYNDGSGDMNGFMYSFTALDGNTPVAPIYSGLYTVYETDSFNAFVTPVITGAASLPAGAGSVTDQVIMGGSQLVCLLTNGTFVDFIGILHPDGLCKAYETATGTTYSDGTKMTIVDTVSGHSYILHSSKPECSLSGAYTQQIAYGYKKVSGSWVLDPGYSPNPVLLQ